MSLLQVRPFRLNDSTQSSMQTSCKPNSISSTYLRKQTHAQCFCIYAQS